MSNPYREYRGMVYTAGTMAVGADRYGDSTVYRGEQSKDGETPTLDVQSTMEMWQKACQRAQDKLDALEPLAKRMALDLECLTLDPQNAHWHDTANESLQRFRDLMDAWYPQDHVSPLGKD